MEASVAFLLALIAVAFGGSEAEEHGPVPSGAMCFFSPVLPSPLQPTALGQV